MVDDDDDMIAIARARFAWAVRMIVSAASNMLLFCHVSGPVDRSAAAGRRDWRLDREIDRMRLVGGVRVVVSLRAQPIDRNRNQTNCGEDTFRQRIENNHY